jgi:hypothetical protein
VDASLKCRDDIGLAGSVSSSRLSVLWILQRAHKFASRYFCQSVIVRLFFMTSGRYYPRIRDFIRRVLQAVSGISGSLFQAADTEMYIIQIHMLIRRDIDQFDNGDCAPLTNREAHDIGHEYFASFKIHECHGSGRICSDRNLQYSILPGNIRRAIVVRLPFTCYSSRNTSTKCGGRDSQ